MNWKTNVFKVESYKSVIEKWLGGSTKIKAEGVPKHPSCFDADGKHPLYIDEKLKER